jgi:hypothetical protein
MTYEKADDRTKDGAKVTGQCAEYTSAPFHSLSTAKRHRIVTGDHAILEVPFRLPASTQTGSNFSGMRGSLVQWDHSAVWR